MYLSPIYFEPLAPGVREFNYVEVGKDPFGNFYGIKLHSRPKPSNRKKTFTPESLGYDHYMSQPFTPDSAWHFSNEPYKDIITPGKAQIKIHLARLPKELAGKAPSVTLMKENQILRKEETTLATPDNKDSGEKWMTENNIKGEHVYVTREEWKLLETMIGFTAIPRGVLAGKDGKLIESDFYIGNYSTDDLKSLVGRF